MRRTRCFLAPKSSITTAITINMDTCQQNAPCSQMKNILWSPCCFIFKYHKIWFLCLTIPAICIVRQQQAKQEETYKAEPRDSKILTSFEFGSKIHFTARFKILNWLNQYEYSSAISHIQAKITNCPSSVAKVSYIDLLVLVCLDFHANIKHSFIWICFSMRIYLSYYYHLVVGVWTAKPDCYCL